MTDEKEKVKVVTLRLKGELKDKLEAEIAKSFADITPQQFVLGVLKQFFANQPQ